MPNKNIKEQVDQAETVDDFIDALEAFRDEFETLEKRVENLEEDKKTKVRVVDTDNGKKIVLENRQQTWFSPNYFRKILDRIDGDEASDDEEIIKG
jgi:hypothetical protein